jgi:hypothetical protein
MSDDFFNSNKLNSQNLLSNDFSNKLNLSPEKNNDYGYSGGSGNFN